MRSNRRLPAWGVCLFAGLLTGCAGARAPYEYGRFPATDPACKAPAVVVVYGAPCKRIDKLARILGLRERLTWLNAKVNQHEVSPATLDKLKRYLVENDLSDVVVYVNHYDPKLQWRRRRANSLMRPGWRYTLGTLDLVNYTLFPGRIFGGDRYDPYTNSLYLNSDVPAIVLHEAAYAKDIHTRKRRGPYVAVNELPVLGVWRHARAIRDVVGYARAHHDWELERSTYHVLYPRTGAEIAAAGTPLTHVWWGGPLLGLGGAACGHVTGRTVAAYRGSRREGTPALAPDAFDTHQVSYDVAGDGEPLDQSHPDPTGPRLAFIAERGDDNAGPRRFAEDAVTGESSAFGRIPRPPREVIREPFLEGPIIGAPALPPHEDSSSPPELAAPRRTTGVSRGIVAGNRRGSFLARCLPEGMLPGWCTPESHKDRGIGVPLEQGGWRTQPFSISGFAGMTNGSPLVPHHVLERPSFYGGLNFGWDYDHYWGFEKRLGFGALNVTNALHQALQTGITSTGEYRLMYYSLGDARWRPFVTGGVGWSEFYFQDDNYQHHFDAFVMLPLGAGLKYQLYDRLALRIDLIDELTLGSGAVANIHYVALAAGLEFRYGRRLLRMPWHKKFDRQLP